MSAIIQSNLDAIFISFSKNFADAYASEPAPLLEAIGSKIPSNTRDQRYPFVQALSSAMREFVGERRLNNIVLDGFVVTNKVWENSLAIKRTDIEFDQLSAYSDMLIPSLAANAKLLPDQLISQEIEANNKCYDGKAFFATDHPQDPSGATTGTAMSNLKTGLPLNATNLAKVQAVMMSYKRPSGIPMGCYGDTILVPPSLKYVADTLVNASFYPEAKNGSAGATFAAQSNVMQGQYKVVVSPWLTDSGDPSTAVWYLLDGRNAKLRPFFYQEFQAPQLVSVVDPAAVSVFMRDEFMMGARAIGNSGAGLWFKAIQVSGA